MSYYLELFQGGEFKIDNSINGDHSVYKLELYQTYVIMNKNIFDMNKYEQLHEEKFTLIQKIRINHDLKRGKKIHKKLYIFCQQIGDAMVISCFDDIKFMIAHIEGKKLLIQKIETVYIDVYHYDNGTMDCFDVQHCNQKELQKDIQITNFQLTKLFINIFRNYLAYSYIN